MNDARLQWRREASEFAQTRIAPYAAASDRAAALDQRSVQALRERGFLGAFLPTEVGGLGLDAVSYGELTAEVGRACSAARTMMTVHDIVAVAIQRWGSQQLKSEFLGQLARGEVMAAFALSEAGAGSDVQAVRAAVRADGDNLILTGEKTWVSFGLTAGLFLVFATSEAGSIALLVPGDCDGLERRPVRGMVGVRAGLMATLTFNNCILPARLLIGRPGFGLSHVAMSALDHGRYSIAWGAVGIIESAYSAAWEFARNRQHSGQTLSKQPLIAAELARIAALSRASRQVCAEAGRLRAARSVSAMTETSLAKYFSTQSAVEAANRAVQILGARGLSEDWPAERLLRDAKATEIIEGTTQVLAAHLGSLNLGAPL